MKVPLYKKIIIFTIIFLIIESIFTVEIGAVAFTLNTKSTTEDNMSSDFTIKNNDDFDENISYYMDQGHMPSLSACIVKNNSVVWQNGYGFSNIYKGIKATENTVYLGASLSKTITATAILQLWEQDLFELDDDVNEYLPFSLRNPNYPEINITIRMLLAHHYSLSKGEYSTFFYFSLLGLSKEDYKEYLDPSGKFYNPDLWLNNRPGEKLEYSNLGYIIIEYLIELLSHQSFDEYCYKNIFQPLEMKNTSFHVGDYEKNNLARPYIWISNNYIPLPHYENKFYSIGGIRTSVLDLSNFLIANMNDGSYNGKRILREETLQHIRTVQFPDSNQSTWYVYGLGWRISSRNNVTSIGHSGTMPGTNTYMNYRPSEKTGIIFFTNQYPILNEIDIMQWLNILFLLYEKAENL